MAQIDVERHDAVAVVRITLPDEFMTEQTVGELNAATQELEQDASCRAIVFTGGQEGVFIRHYHVGVLEEMSGELRRRGMTFSEGKLLTRDRDIDVLLRRLGAMPKVTIAAINGFAMGGGFEFCLACDLRIAQRGDYHLGLPEIKIGILPGAGGTQRLARLLGGARAMEMILRGRTVPPDEALTLGMVHELTDGPVLPKALELAGDYASMSPLAVGHIKRLVRQGVEMPLEDALTLERTLFLDLLVSDEASDLMGKMNRKGVDIRDVEPD